MGCCYVIPLLGYEKHSYTENVYLTQSYNQKVLHIITFMHFERYIYILFTIIQNGLTVQSTFIQSILKNIYIYIHDILEIYTQ